MLAAFRAHGAATVSSDEIVHHLLRTDPDVKAALVERFGERILDEDGVPDRGRIAAIVFDDPESLAFLEQLLHPLVSREYLSWREQVAALESPPSVTVTEVPLLFESGGETRSTGSSSSRRPASCASSAARCRSTTATAG